MCTSYTSKHPKKSYLADLPVHASMEILNSVEEGHLLIGKQTMTAQKLIGSPEQINIHLLSGVFLVQLIVFLYHFSYKTV